MHEPAAAAATGRVRRRAECRPVPRTWPAGAARFGSGHRAGQRQDPVHRHGEAGPTDIRTCREPRAARRLPVNAGCRVPASGLGSAGARPGPPTRPRRLAARSPPRATRYRRSAARPRPRWRTRVEGWLRPPCRGTPAAGAGRRSRRARRCCTAGTPARRGTGPDRPGRSRSARRHASRSCLRFIRPAPPRPPSTPAGWPAGRGPARPP